MLYKLSGDEWKEFVLNSQLLQDRTSIRVISALNCIHKLAIAQKECGEILY
ncbi:MAG: hypothetical protein LBG92_10055 [Prevotellaceae bacterium]|nr:hypothetical protein [Prevotellaceae bacterium]